MNKVTYTIPNISCDHCVHTIKTEVADLPGVSVVDVDRESKEVSIQFDDPASEKTILALLQEINYPPQTA